MLHLSIVRFSPNLISVSLLKSTESTGSGLVHVGRQLFTARVTGGEVEVKMIRNDYTAEELQAIEPVRERISALLPNLTIGHNSIFGLDLRRSVSCIRRAAS